MKNTDGNSNILKIFQSKTFGYHDLLIKESGSKWKKIFKWNPEVNHYFPAD